MRTQAIAGVEIILLQAIHRVEFAVVAKAVKAPAHVDLKTYPAQRRGNKVFINIPDAVGAVKEEPTLQVSSSN